jgi:hypothetical protein
MTDEAAGSKSTDDSSASKINDDRLYFIVAILVGLILFAGSLGLRGQYGDGYEIQTGNLILLLLPIAAWFVLTGQLQNLKVGTSGIELAFQRAVASSISMEYDKIPIHKLVTVEKEGEHELSTYN